MILVDTSVLINKLRKIENKKTQKLDELHRLGTPYGISIYTFHEILQGAKTEVEFKKLYEYFSTQIIFSLPDTPEIFAQSAAVYCNLRRAGTTIRNTIDILIAYTAIYHDIQLLHDDADFDFIAEKTKQLKILEC